ncbi:MAG: hypothetical protein QXI58_01260 [Candidatus Micrarchaeia archaeon]
MKIERTGIGWGVTKDWPVFDCSYDVWYKGKKYAVEARYDLNRITIETFYKNKLIKNKTIKDAVEKEFKATLEKFLGRKV